MFHDSANEVHMKWEGWNYVAMASPGFGSAANCHLPLINVNAGTAPRYLPGRLHRARDPGAGASTSYHNRQSTALKRIAAGQELFVDYSEAWFVGRPHFGPVPLKDDYDRSTLLVHQYFALAEEVDLPVFQSESPLEKNQELPSASNHSVMDDLWTDFISNTDFSWSRVLFGINRDDREQLKQLQAQQATADSSTDSTPIPSITELRERQTIRSDEWLREHGTCGDHIAPGPASVSPQAGLGALATRTLPAGVIVAQMPLVHIADRNKLAMYPLKSHKVDGEWRSSPDRVS
jgi:hypothetical protein